MNNMKHALKIRKAQSDIISMVMIVIITMGLVGTAYTWGIPLIEKQQSGIIVERLYHNYFDINNANSLPRLIEDVANSDVEGVVRVFTVSETGLWELSGYDEVGEQNNSIQFTINAKVSNIGMDIGWIPMTTGGTCPPITGTLGVDEEGVVCVKAETIENGYKITYRLWSRELEEGGGAKGYKINLVRHAGGPLASTGRTVRITRGSIQSTMEDGKTLKTTEVKILLE